MKITLLCSSEDHPINDYLAEWVARWRGQHEIETVRRIAEASGGDLLFLISCSELVTKADRDCYTAALVIHASDLPQGRGWSPHIWQLLEGRSQFAVTLLEAEDAVDSGEIWHQITCEISEHALWDEINHCLFETELALMDHAVQNWGNIQPRPQDKHRVPSYYPKRSPADSSLDPSRSLTELFNSLRLADPNRFPAFFQLHGHTYKLKVEKISHG